MEGAGIVARSLSRRPRSGRSERSAGLAGIEAVFFAHAGYEREVLAAGNQAHDRRAHMTTDNFCFDDIGLVPAIGGEWALRIDCRAIIDRILSHDHRKTRPFVFRRRRTPERWRHRIDNDLFFLSRELAL